MESTELNDIYTNLGTIINYLNHPSFPNLKKIIADEVSKASEKSLTDWVNSLPSSFIKTYYDDEMTKDAIKENLRETYSVPFLHLKNQKWAQAIVSMQLSLADIKKVRKQVQRPLNTLAQNIVVVMQYVDYAELNTDEEQLVSEAQAKVNENLATYEYLCQKMRQWDSLNPNLHFTFENLYANKDYYRKYFNVSVARNVFLNEITEYIQKIYQQISMKTITDYSDEIKKIWKLLKQRSMKNELATLSFSKVQKIIDQINPDFHLIDYFSNVADFLKVDNSTLKRLYKFNDSELIQIKNVIEALKTEVERRAYPHLNPDNLSEEEYQLLALIREYQDHPEIKNAQVNILKDELEQLSSLINVFRDLAVNRYLANLLPDDKYKIWCRKEIEIYEKYASVRQLGDALFPDKPRKSETHLDLQNDLKKHIADYNSIIDNIVNKNPNFSNLNNLPDFVVNEVLKQELNTDNLKVEKLRRYQEFAAQFILRYKKVLLGDEMGLGKTIEALTVINHLYNKGKKYFIVAAPLSILTNWKRETKSRTNLNPYIFHDANKFAEFDLWKADGGVLITNYEQCEYLKTLLEDMSIDMIVVDEAHSIKNPSAKRTQNIRKIIVKSNYVLLMTGTPLENRVNEMNSLINILDPKIAQKLETLSTLSSEVYKRTVATVYLRRRRIDVLQDLPQIVSVQSYSHFTDEQEEEYRKYFGDFMLMRRIAFHGPSEKVDQIVKICEDARENKEKVLIFSFFKEEVIFKLQKILPHVASEPITGDISAKRRQEVIDDFSKSDDQSVLLCQINAAGYGLNIQAASRVIICEPQFKPSVEQQAISRAYRMGQRHTVTVYHLITENSIDETMINVLNYKQKLFDKFADKSIAAKVLSKVIDKDSNDKSTLSDNQKKKDIMKKEKERYINAQ